MIQTLEVGTIIYAVILFFLFLLFVVFIGAIMVKGIRNVYRALKAETQYIQKYEEVNEKLDRVLELLEKK